MSDRMIPQRKKVATSSFTTSSLSSPTTSTLVSPIRNFNLQLHNNSAEKTQESPSLQEEQPKSEQSSESEKLQKPLFHDISRISLRPQTRVTVNQPGDVYEQEADLMAQRVMRTSTLPITTSDDSAAQDILQRKCITCEKEDEENSRKFPIMPLLQREVSSDRSEVNDNLGNFENRLTNTKGGGSPLSDEVRGFMEPRFGTYFSRVRVHTDSTSVQMNRDLSAQAFTHGSDIYYGGGKSPAKDELTAHELTHVVQQNGGAVQRSILPNPQTKALSSKHPPAIQLRENPQKQIEDDNQGQPEQVDPKVKTEKGKGQDQAPAEKGAVVDMPLPPGDGNGAPTDTPPPDGNPSATQNKKNSHKQPQQDKQGKLEQADPNTKSEKGEEKQQRQVVGGLLGADTNLTAGLPGAKTGGEVGGLPRSDANSTAGLPGAKKTGDKVAVDDGEKAPASPKNDPAFQAVVNTTKEVAGQQKKHEPANSKAHQAQAAAQPPGNEVDSKAQANQVGKMGQAETPGFDAAAFKAKLMERIADMAPKNLEEADNFKNNNKLDSVKGDLSGQVKEEQKSSQGQLEEKTKEKPDPSGIEAKQVTPLPKNEPGTPPTGVGADQAAPKSKGQGEVEAPLQDDSKKLDQQMKEADVTEEQLANSNEPEFQGALAAKKDAQTNAVEAPPKYRQQEQGILATAQTTAEATAQQHLQAMHNNRTQNLGHVGEQQVGAKGKDEQARAKVAGDINKIYDKTKGKVEKTLSELDGQVIQAFDAGAAEAKKAFEDYVGKRMDKYKSDRYSGFWGPGKWLIDKLFGMPSEVNAFYQEGRQLYINQMDGVINKVVAIISKGLTQAKAEIANGKQEIQNYVNQLPQDLKGVGQQAAADIDSKFEELQQSVDDKQDELIDTLAQKYQENLKAVDARIEEMKAANKGLIQKAFDFVVGVIKTIIELTKMLLEVLARVAGVIGQILKDPIGFLGNLIQALKQGFLNFMNNIGKHLQQGLIGWLTGTMAETGIQMPENLDIKGIFSLAMQLLGFTYEAIRAQAVKRLGEEKVSRLEQTVDIFQVLASQGVAGMWQFVQDKIGDLNALVIEPIKNFIIEKVIIAGIEWILSLLNPASAFIKAAKAIYEIVKFFIERAQQIADLINAILDAIGAIASGAIDQAIKGVENALAKSLPVVISFLASLLGLGGIAGKIQAIFQKLRKPMEKAVDWVIDKGAKAFKKVGNKVKNSKFGKKAGELKDSAKEKYKAGKQWIEDKKEAGQNWVNDKKAAAEQWVEDKKEGVSNKFKNSKFGKKVGAVTESAKDKYKAGKQWVKDKKEAGKQWVEDKKEAANNWVDGKKKSVKDKFDKFGNKVKDKFGFGKDKESKEKQAKDRKDDERTMEQKKADVHKAVVDAEKIMEQKGATPDSIKTKLPAIQSHYKLTAIELVKEKSNKYHIEAKINPEENSDSISLEDGERKPATIKKIFFASYENQKATPEGEAWYGDWLLKKLNSFAPGLEDSKLKTRKNTIESIRGDDNTWKVLQGAIYAPLIEDNRQAIQTLQGEMDDCKYLLSLERGGAFLADQLTKGKNITSEKIEKRTLSEEEAQALNTKTDAHKVQQQYDLKERIKQVMSGKEKENITIAIAETLVGGGSRDALIKTVKDILESGEYPNLKFKLLLLQQTIHTEDEGQGIVQQGLTKLSGITEANRIQIVTGSTKYILGEDVGYQLAKSGGNSNKPVIVFQGTKETLVAYQITPEGNTTARDIIIDLNAGAYTGLLAGIL